jgi:hypothetical protein
MRTDDQEPRWVAPFEWYRFGLSYIPQYSPRRCIPTFRDKIPKPFSVSSCSRSMVSVTKSLCGI